jgi:hypothetical protein
LPILKSASRDTSRYGNVEVVPREEFIRDFGERYNVSQRLTMIGPPGRGKTRLGMELLSVCISPATKATLLHGKIQGRDKLIPVTAKNLKMRVISTWPPSYNWNDRKRNGWILAPLEKPGDNTREENAILREQFAAAIHDNYHTPASKPRITVIDESHQAQYEMRLKEDIEAPMMRGRPDNAVWNFIQRGRFVSYHCYEVEHMIVFYDSDADNQQRYAQIGDVDPQQIRYLIERLERREIASGEVISDALYMNRNGYMCIIGMD